MNLYIFCDESCTNDNFMLYGGFICDLKTQTDIQNQLLDFKSNNGLKHEVKWTNLKSGNLERYKAFIDIIFSFVEQDRIHFKFLAVEMCKLNHKKYNNGDPELGFYKLYMQQLLHQFGKPHYSKENNTQFHIRLDSRTTKYPLSTLREILNASIKKKYRISDKPFRSIEVRDSKQCIHIQLNDLILGAACFIKNNKFEDSTIMHHKKKLAEYIRDKSEISFSRNESNRHFSFWDFKLKK